MGGLFGPDVGTAPAPDEVAVAAAALPPQVRFGTSSWTFPGWDGLVWDRKTSKEVLVREGLPAYSAHPALRTVGIDRTFYGPVGTRTYETWARQVPAHFRFMVKAHEHITTARFSKHPRYGALAGQANPRFLDADYATEAVVGPTTEGLGPHLGVLLFQFPPTNPDILGPPQVLAQKLDRFLDRLPDGVPYAIELRSPAWLTPDYAQVLVNHGVRHSYVVHPTMPGIAEQMQRVPGGARPGVLIRWMLQSGWSYDDAVAAFSPFTRRAAPDETTQSQVARLVKLAIGRDKDVIVIINNKAEGCAPRTLFELIRRTAR
ncbi:MAG: DUF72 domain-containing protein [Myxococcota bacterium]